MGKLKVSSLHSMSFERPIIHILLIIILGLLAYSNTFNVPFHWDDRLNIVENPHIKSLSNIPTLFKEFKGPPIAARPLTSATFAVNYYLCDLNTTRYHIFNLILHITNGILLYYLIIMTAGFLNYTGNNIRLVALFSALLFIAHPIQTESVTYIVSRSVLLSATFFLLGILLFAKAVTEERKKVLYTVALFLTSLLGMASREEFFIFPFMLILYDFFFLSKLKPKGVIRHYRFYIPVFLSLSYLIYIVLNYDYQEHAGFEVKTATPLQYLFTQFNAHWTYLRLLFLPINQNLDYDYPIAKSLLELPTIISFVGYLACWFTGIYLYKIRPALSFSILWFMLTLAPSSSIIPIKDVIFEHRVYLPSIGLFIALVTSMPGIVQKCKESPWKIEKSLISVIALIIFVLSGSTFMRNNTWTDEIRLWEDVVKKSPIKARVHNNLGLSYMSKSLLDKAIEHYQIALGLMPEYSLAHYNIGLAYRLKGLTDKAIEHFEIALKLNLENAELHNNLGLAYGSKGLSEKAINHFQIALRLNPNFAEAHFNLGLLYLEKGITDNARREFETALQINPYDNDSKSFLSFILKMNKK